EGNVTKQRNDSVGLRYLLGIDDRRHFSYRITAGETQRARVELRYAVMTTQKTAIFLALVLIATFAFHPLAAQNAQQTFPLKRFEVIRVDVDDIRRLPPSVRPIFSDPAPDGELVKSLDEAAKLAGFTPRLLKSRTIDQIAVVNPLNAEIKVTVGELTGAL